MGVAKWPAMKRVALALSLTVAAWAQLPDNELLRAGQPETVLAGQPGPLDRAEAIVELDRYKTDGKPSVADRPEPNCSPAKPPAPCPGRFGAPGTVRCKVASYRCSGSVHWRWRCCSKSRAGGRWACELLAHQPGGKIWTAFQVFGPLPACTPLFFEEFGPAILTFSHIRGAFQVALGAFDLGYTAVTAVPAYGYGALTGGTWARLAGLLRGLWLLWG